MAPRFDAGLAEATEQNRDMSGVLTNKEVALSKVYGFFNKVFWVKDVLVSAHP